MGDISGKVVVVGDSGSGKSSIISMYINKTFNLEIDSTIGACFFLHTFIKDSISLKLSIWDTAGQEKYDNVACIYARNSDVVVIVCDSSSTNQVQSLSKWHNKIVRDLYNNEVFVVIAANKIDLSNSLELPLISKYAEEVHAQFYKTSAKENTNIQEMFEDISNRIIARRKESKLSSFTLNSSKKVRQQSKKSCCT